MVNDSEHNKVILSRDAAIARAAAREARIRVLLRGAWEALAGQPPYIGVARERLESIQAVLDGE